MKVITLKKTITMLLAMILACSFIVGCGGNITPSESTPESTPEESIPESTPEATEPESSETEPESTEPESSETEPPVEPLKSDFEIYQSNSITPTACNYALKSGGKAVTKTFRGLFKIQEYGELEYKFYFSNNVDSTFSNGSHSYRNMPTESYKIISATVGTTSSPFGTGKINNPKALTFGGSVTRDVKGGEMFWSDALTLNIPNGHWLIFEWTVEYTVIAATNSENVALALFECTNGSVATTDAAPMPALVGADRGNSIRIAFIGDSITMGIGAGSKNYKGWAAQITERLGTTVSAWNLGVGYARGDDAANSPAWLEKAKNNDVVVICFGVNDINSGPYNFSGQRNATDIKNDIAKIAETCADAGAEIIIFTTPPYTYANSTKVTVWRALVNQLKTLAAEKGYKLFDFAAIVGTEADPSVPAYGGHPNAEGCRIVAEKFIESGLIEIPEN